MNHEPLMLVVAAILDELERHSAAQETTLESAVKTAEQEVLAAGKSLADIYQVITQQFRELNEELNTVSDKFSEFSSILGQALENIPTMFLSMVEHARRQLEWAVQAREQMSLINSFADAISKISFSSRLLAVNAHIQAAHAGGETGKAFSVVAQNMTELYKEVKSATDQIETVSHSVGDTLTRLSETTDELVDAGQRRCDDLADTIRDTERSYGGSRAAMLSAFGELREVGDRVKARSNDAIIHLQFEDRVRQSIAHARKRWGGVRGFLHTLQQELQRSQNYDPETIKDAVASARKKADEIVGEDSGSTNGSTSGSGGELLFF